VTAAIELAGDEIKEILPAGLRQEMGFMPRRDCIKRVHFPSSLAEAEAARRQLAFEELFCFSSGLALMRARRERIKVPALEIPDMAPFLKSLRFSFTGAQRRALEDILKDFSSGSPANRLIQGDVGSGKTAVAAGAVFAAVQNGLQAAVMAPTVILAEQLYAELTALLSPLGMRAELFSSTLTPAARKSLAAQLKAGEIDIAVGTHALITRDLEFCRLGLVIADEQHRFGVNQRAALGAKGEHPHVIMMSATPIPRSLGLIIYGELDVSVIDELPPGRKPVSTHLPGEHKRADMYAFIRKLAAEGKKTYIVCPLVEESEQLDDLTSAEELAERLRQQELRGLKIGLIHGRMKPKEKEAVMREFSEGDTHVLVSTTVIEVGVNVPSACLMVIENAERFGLSQLHQLRGRVGRSSEKSWCMLFGGGGETAEERLKVMCRTNDGFEIAEQDLKLRGPGDFFGSRQHGMPRFRVADLAADMPLLDAANRLSSRLLSADPSLSDPENAEIKRRVDELFKDEE